MYTILSSIRRPLFLKKARKKLSMPTPLLGMIAGNIAGAAASTGLGMLLGNHNDARQIRQQEALTKMQLKAQKEAAKYQSDLNYKNQMQIWKDTNYSAQLEEILKAGLNPALIYGTSGAGGQLGGTTGMPGVTGGQATQNPGELQQIMGMGLQLQMQQAQIKLAEAQANKTNVEADKIAGVDTEESKARIESLLQGVDNARQQHEIQKLEITLKNIENFEKQATQADRMDYIEYQTRIAAKQLNIVENEAFISKATMQQKIDIVKQEAIGAALRNALTRAQTGQTVEQTRLAKDQQKKIVNEIMLNWDKLENEKKETFIKEQLMLHNVDPTTDVLRGLTGTIGNIFKSLKL